MFQEGQWERFELFPKLDSKRFLSHPPHKRFFLFHEEEFAAVDNADAIGEKFSLLDIVGSENDGGP